MDFTVSFMVLIFVLHNHIYIAKTVKGLFRKEYKDCGYCVLLYILKSKIDNSVDAYLIVSYQTGHYSSLNASKSVLLSYELNITTSYKHRNDFANI